VCQEYGLIVEYLLLAIRLAMFYGTRYWAIKKQHIHKIGVAEMKMLRWISGSTWKNRI
jgi:hypothetical protein